MRKYLNIILSDCSIKSITIVFYRDSSEDKSDSQCVDDQSQTQSEAQQALNQFWPKVLEEIRAIRNVNITVITICLYVFNYCYIVDGFETTSTSVSQDKKDHETR